MNTHHRILVTGVGALIGQGIVHGLREGGRSWVLGLDRRESILARELCDEILLKPKLDEESDEYVMFWADVLSRYNVEMVMPGITIDMMFLDSNRDLFEQLGVKLVLNSPELIALTRNKVAFQEDYATLGLPIIPSVCGGTWEEAIAALGPAPLLLKPASGEGSAGVVLLSDRTDFIYWTKKNREGFLVQKIVGTTNDEYTVGIFGFGDGTYLGPIIFRRWLTRAGNTGMAETVSNSVIADVTDTIARHYRPVGPTNLQFRMDGDLAFLMEINPRFSSSCSIRSAFGFNEPEMCVDYYLRNRRPAQPDLKQGLAQRHQMDWIRLDRPDI